MRETAKVGVGRTNQFSLISQILYSYKSTQLVSLAYTKDFRIDVLFGLQWRSGGRVGVVVMESATARWKVSVISPQWALTWTSGLEYLLTAPWHSCYPKGERKLREWKGAPFPWGWHGTHLTVTCHFEIPLSQGVYRRILETWQIINVSRCEPKGFVTHWLEHHDFLTKPGGK